MVNPASRNVWAMISAFALGIIVAVIGPRFFDATLRHLLFPKTSQEIARVTSPDNAVDAVMLVTDCGAPCSSSYTVYVIPKGGKAPNEPAQLVFSADDMADEKLIWVEPRLLEIVYRKALIQRFSNVAKPSGRPGQADSWDYAVEIRLAPTTAGFSYLEDNGH